MCVWFRAKIEMYGLLCVPRINSVHFSSIVI